MKEIDSINVREKANVPELDLDKLAQDPNTMEEENCCGNCCWFYGEDTDGWGFCACQKNRDIDMEHCSDMCEDDFVSREEMRHHMAVLLQANRYRRDNNVPAIYRMPDPTELGKAIDFSVKYMKVFSKL